MKGSTNIWKGRIKEAAGALTGNRKLREKGRKDQSLGQVEKSAEEGVKKAKKSADEIVEHAKDTAEKEVDKVKKQVS